jgi:hypothetical protein
MDELTSSRLYEPIPTVDDLILTVDDLAALLKLRPKTIYNHISAGRLTRDDGVCHLNERCVRVVWTLFLRRMLAGKISLSIPAHG